MTNSTTRMKKEMMEAVDSLFVFGSSADDPFPVQTSQPTSNHVATQRASTSGTQRLNDRLFWNALLRFSLMAFKIGQAMANNKRETT